MADFFDPFSRANIPAIPTVQSDREQQIVIELMALFAQLQVWRNTFANQWEEVAQLLMPEWRNTFYYGNQNWPGMKKAERQIDSNGMRCNHKFAAICDSLLTPRNMIYEQLVSHDKSLRNDPDCQKYFEDCTNILFEQRYSEYSNFEGQQHQNYMFLGAFGTQAMYIEPFHAPVGHIRALRYRSIPMGELYLVENDQGLICGFVRWFRMTAAQCFTKFGYVPAELSPALEKRAQTQYDFLHWVDIRKDYDPERWDAKGMPWASYYVSVTGLRLMREAGFHSFPLAVGRYTQVAGEVYGRSWAMMTLPTLKTANAMKTVNLVQSHRAAAPVLLTADDGLVDTLSQRPGAINPGGVGPNGEELVKVLPNGNIPVAKEMLEAEAAIMEDMSLVSLFKLIEDAPQLTATQVIEMVNEKGILLAPTIGRQESEYISPLTAREMDVLSQLGLLPPMPKKLRDAGGLYQVTHCSPMALQQRAGRTAGIMRTVEMGLNIVQATQDNSALDELSVPRAMHYVAESNSVPYHVLATPAEKAAKAKARAQAQQAAQQTAATGPNAAMLGAKAKMVTAQKSGGGGGAPVPPPGISAPVNPPNMEA